MTQGQQRDNAPRWPHRCALLLACATFPLIWVGALLTTTDAGMAVPDWPNTFGYNLFLYPWTTWVYGPWSIFVEHGHRLLGSLAGMLTIALVAAVWFGDRRRWVRVLSVVALLAVVGQGVLGGLRVLLDARTLAMIHGCVGPAFFALAVSLAVCTSRVWTRRATASVHRNASALQRLALLTAVLAYLQIVLGAQLRHVPVSAAPGDFRVLVIVHLVVAAALAVHAAMLAWRSLQHHRDEPALWAPSACVAALVGVQIVLGGATWVLKYSWPSWVGQHGWSEGYTIAANSTLQTVVVTAHVAVGSLILAAAVAVALLALRLLRAEPREARCESRAVGVPA